MKFKLKDFKQIVVVPNGNLVGNLVPHGWNDIENSFCFEPYKTSYNPSLLPASNKKTNGASKATEMLSRQHLPEFIPIEIGANF